MKTLNPNFTATHTLARRAPIFATVASLLIAPCLFAQTPAPEAKDAPGPGANPAEQQLARRYYTLKFDGGLMSNLSNLLRETFPDDNFVIDDFDQQLALPSFELRKVRPEEIGRTLEFLSRGLCKVEIVSNEPHGNIWRIGPAKKSAQAAGVKMRSVAAPNLFSNENSLAEIRKAAEEMEWNRLHMISLNVGDLRRATMELFASQNLFVIIGDEEGVAGLENLINAAEQQLAQAAAARDASLAANAPKMRTVLAPHVFSQEDRLNKLMANAAHMEMMWSDLNAKLSQATGSQGKRFFGAQIEPRSEQKVFVILGSEDAIAGMESLIQAAEKLAMEEDGKISAEIQAERAKQMAEKAKAEEASKAAEERAGKDKGEQ